MNMIRKAIDVAFKVSVYEILVTLPLWGVWYVYVVTNSLPLEVVKKMCDPS